MKYVLHDLAIETTRRCNIRCGHCMRGLSQNVDITPDIIDTILGKEEIVRIDKICFSGGEPTLNPNIIIYTINKIIEENISVKELVMVTNGQIFNKELIDAFNRFNEYRNRIANNHLIQLLEKKGELNDDLENKIKNVFESYVRITFSTDKYHHPISDEVKDNYHKFAKGLIINEMDTEEKEIYKTGFATVGKDFDYKLDRLRYYNDGDEYNVLDNIYVTALGYVTSEGMGQYTDMDRINLGHISDTSIGQALVQCGVPIFGSQKITPEMLAEEKKHL